MINFWHKFLDLTKTDSFKRYFWYSLYILVTFALLIFVFGEKHVRGFFTTIENKTFDVRQNIAANKRFTNKDIVIISVDDASYEYLLGKYGEWPISRGIYADMIEYLQAQKPAVIAFDLMFVKSIKSSNNDDSKLAKSISKYDNVFTAINFDDLEETLRKPADLPEYLKAKIVNNAGIPLVTFAYPNCRVIIDEIMKTTPNIGQINIIRAEDGITRDVPIFAMYKKDYYPYLAVKVAQKYLERQGQTISEKFVVDENRNLLIGDKKIPLTIDGKTILNWYGKANKTEPSAFITIPMWKIEREMYEGEHLLLDDFFRNKIVYIGTSATSLFDIKSVPTDDKLPGVEIHTTLLNNFLDQNFIIRSDIKTDVLISLILSLFVGILVIRVRSTFISSVTAIFTTIVYIVINYLIMKYFHLWIALVLPLVSVVFVFIAVYIAKYIIKSRDFDYTYALATTDGLTELYNHRYFQEQMAQNVATCKRYNNEFSLILIDIDFFKKFNDTYGHQAGDAVLRQVAQVLKKNVRSTDVVCRYGGEEMSIILTNTNKQDAIVTAQKICDAVAAKPFKLGNGIEKHVTISLGVATFPENGETPADLIKHSDDGLYKAKENGRNQVGIL